jgi:two-component system response regulator RegX3
MLMTEIEMSVNDETRPPRVLVVEDEEPILDGLLELFRVQGFEADGVTDGAEALERLTSRDHDLVLLDLMIPSVPGLEVLRQIRAAGRSVPVLVLTALGAEADIVAGLEAGADDYVTKPFGIHELMARAQGLLRRARISPELPHRFTVGTATVDLDRLVITWPGGEPLALTSREGVLLQHLTARRHRPVSREELLVEVWGYRDGSMRTRTVDVHVAQLRAKLHAVPGGDTWIETVRGRGYRFVEQSCGPLKKL